MRDEKAKFEKAEMKSKFEKENVGIARGMEERGYRSNRMTVEFRFWGKRRTEIRCEI